MWIDFAFLGLSRTSSMDISGGGDVKLFFWLTKIIRENEQKNLEKKRTTHSKISIFLWNYILTCQYLNCKTAKISNTASV